MRTEQGKSTFDIYIPLGFIFYLVVYFSLFFMYPFIWLSMILFSLVSFGIMIKTGKLIQMKSGNQSGAKL